MSSFSFIYLDKRIMFSRHQIPETDPSLAITRGYSGAAWANGETRQLIIISIEECLLFSMCQIPQYRFSIHRKKQ